VKLETTPRSRQRHSIASREERITRDPLTRPAPADKNAGGGPPSPPRGRGPQAASGSPLLQFRRHCLGPLALGVLPFLLSCGYQVAGRGDRLPPDIKTIAVPIFVNHSSTFRIEEKLAAAITHEFIERTKFRITPNPTGADAVLKGTVKDVRSGVITFDLSTGRASSLQIQVTADVKLEDLHSKKVVYANPNFVFREEYQVSQTTSGLFQEDQAALDRLSRDVARTLVTEVLENF